MDNRLVIKIAGADSSTVDDSFCYEYFLSLNHIAWMPRRPCVPMQSIRTTLTENKRRLRKLLDANCFASRYKVSLSARSRKWPERGNPGGMGVPAGVGFRAWVGRLRACQDAGEAADEGNVTEGAGGRNNVKALGVSFLFGAVRAEGTATAKDLTQRTQRKAKAEGTEEGKSRSLTAFGMTPRCLLERRGEMIAP